MLQKLGMADGNGLLLTCSGASNVGQLSHQAVVELAQEGFGKFFCLAGIGAHLDKFVQSAKNNSEVVVIDGCPVGCAKRIVEHAEIPIRKYMVVTKKEVYRHAGFMGEEAIVAQLKSMGVE